MKWQGMKIKKVNSDYVCMDFIQLFEDRAI